MKHGSCIAKAYKSKNNHKSNMFFHLKWSPPVCFIFSVTFMHCTPFATFIYSSTKNGIHTHTQSYFHLFLLPSLFIISQNSPNNAFSSVFMLNNGDAMNDEKYYDDFFLIVIIIII